MDNGAASRQRARVVANSLNFPIGSVGHTLCQLRGVWHDRCTVYSPSGEPLAADLHSGSPGDAPWENLVYISFDGELWTQTNVTFRGRPAHAKTFGGRLVDGALRFFRLGPEAPEHIGYSGGPGVLWFGALRITDACKRYAEPDCVRLLSPGARTRTTLLYRDGLAVRCLTANGTKIAPVADRRVAWDPRGPSGAVHEPLRATSVFMTER